MCSSTIKSILTLSCDKFISTTIKREMNRIIRKPWKVFHVILLVCRVNRNNRKVNSWQGSYFVPRWRFDHTFYDLMIALGSKRQNNTDFFVVRSHYMEMHLTESRILLQEKEGEREKYTDIINRTFPRKKVLL